MNKIEEMKEKRKPMKILKSRECAEKYILSIVTRLEEPLEHLGVKNMTLLNCMTSTDKTRPIEKLFGGAVKTEYKICGDGAIGGMVQQGENGDETVGCRDDAVGGRLQRVDDDSEMVQGSDVQCRDDAFGGRLQEDEFDENGSLIDGDDATNGEMHYINDEVFSCEEYEMSSVASDCEGEIVDNNMITNISMRSAKSRTGVRQAEDEPGVLTSVRGADGSVGVTEVLLGTVCVADREMTYVRGTRPSRSSCSSTSRQRRRAVTTPPLRGTRRSLTGRLTKRRRTSTLRGGPGTSSTSQMSSAAIHLGFFAANQLG